MIIAITGHRDLSGLGGQNQVRCILSNWMQGIKSKYSDTIIITGGAYGTEIIAAEEAHKANLVFQVYLPFPAEILTQKWTEADKQRLFKVLENAFKETTVSCQFSLLAYKQKNKSMIDAANIVIAFYDGRQRGGTLYAIKYANLQYKPVFDGITQKRLYQISDRIPLGTGYSESRKEIVDSKQAYEDLKYATVSKIPDSAKLVKNNGSYFLITYWRSVDGGYKRVSEREVLKTLGGGLR